MSSAEQFLRELGGHVGTWDEAVRLLHADLGNKTAGVLARAFGVTRRTGERWVAKAEGRTSQASDPTKRNPQRAAELINVVKARRAARRLRAARKIKAGKVRVISKSPAKKGERDPRPRNIGDRPVIGTLADAVRVAADLLEDGEYGRAAEVLSDGLMDAYGVPEGTLGIEDFLGGLSIE